MQAQRQRTQGKRGLWVKVKKILEFYFTAEKTEKMLDRLILKRAAGVDFYRSAESCIESVSLVLEKKRALCSLWQYLDGIINKFTTEERQILENYALDSCPSDNRKEVHRLAVRFARMAQAGIHGYYDGLKVVKEYMVF